LTLTAAAPQSRRSSVVRRSSAAAARQTQQFQPPPPPLPLLCHRRCCGAAAAQNHRAVKFRHYWKPVVDAFGKKVTSCIRVPRIYWEFTRKAVLTMEWIDGIKLIDAVSLEKACLNRKLLINQFASSLQGLYCSLRQMLEEGFFHADPHPGNLVATSDGSLAYFDFGMMGDLPRHYRVGLIQMLVHFVNRDSLSMANDFLSLGFIPEGTDVQSVADALQSSFGHGRKQSQDFQVHMKSLLFNGGIKELEVGIMNQLYDVMYEFNFSLPPDYALVIRALGSLEGTAKILDPDFQVVESAYPYVIGRLLADPTHDMRKILRELLICNNGSIRWNRLERLVSSLLCWKDMHLSYYFAFYLVFLHEVISISFSFAFVKGGSTIIFVRIYVCTHTHTHTHTHIYIYIERERSCCTLLTLHVCLYVYGYCFYVLAVPSADKELAVV
ncbi:Uncharacterized protein EJ110_NYTH58712, partial [Nymphaea thermarum]